MPKAFQFSRARSVSPQKHARETFGSQGNFVFNLFQQFLAGIRGAQLPFKVNTVHANINATKSAEWGEKRAEGNARLRPVNDCNYLPNEPYELKLRGNGTRK